MKKFTIKNVLDGFRSSVAQPARPDQEIIETLRPEHFQVKRTFRHGFPYQPTAMAFDPNQRLLAIGTKCGLLRILGRPGVDVTVRHDMEGSPVAVMHVQFLVNEGALVTATADETLHLWNFRQKVPQVVQKLKFQREKITCMHLPLQSKWLYLGTDRGNIHIVHLETFVLSGYVINWNKAIEVSRKTHPGTVVHLSDNPLDSSKLLIGYETGQVVLWDLRAKGAEFRCQTAEPLRSAAWHHEGKQFMCSHTDGTLTTWLLRQPAKPINVSQPHARPDPGGGGPGGRPPDACKPIGKVEWKSSKTGEAYVIFSGGTAYDQAGRTPSITVVHAKTTTVLEMEHNVVDFITLCETPWSSEMQEPYAIVVLLQNDLVVMDLQTAGYPCLENPYPMDVHESPVTCCAYMADCPADLVPAFYSVGRSAKRTGFSDREWPISGGEWHAASCSYSEIIITGHADGSIKFWDGSAGTLQILYKLKTSKVFERPKPPSGSEEEDPFAVELISMCPESRKLCIAGASGHVILFKFRKQEATGETAVLEIPIVYESAEEPDCSPDYECTRSTSRLDFSDDCKRDNQPTLRVRPGPQKKAPGFQAQLVCLTPWANGEPPGHITALAINSSYGLLAYGNESGIVVVDIVQKISLLNIGSPDLYGAQDPYSRAPRSPKRSDNSAGPEARSPSIDQLMVCPASPAYEPAEEAAPAVPPSAAECPQQERRRSTTWKAFNFKRQLSKVDVRLKNTFSGSDKRGSIFYCADEEEGTPDVVSPQAEDVPTEVAEECTEVESPKGVATRPENLVLGETATEDAACVNACPIRPPRSVKRKPPVKLQVRQAPEERQVRDLREPLDDADQPQQPPTTTSFMRRFSRVDKLDSSFSRSRSSSMSSLENISSEAIQCLAFADSYTKKTEPALLVPTLWVGTSLGSVVTIMIIVPDAEQRSSQPVVVSLVGATIFRLKGSILGLSFLDCNGSLIPYSYESWRDENREKKDRTPTKSQNRMSPTLSAETRGGESFGDRQFVVICSEKQARVVALPSQTCVYRQQITDTDFVIKAETVSVRDSVFLVCYVSSGHLMAYSLPSLRPLVDIDFLPLSELRITRTFCFSNRGHGLYLTSPSELQKFTLCAEFCSSLTEMMGELFLALDMPEPPKESFFKGLFGGGVRSLDRDELFGVVTSGKASKAVAKHIPGQALQERVGVATSEISRAHMLMVQRGDKLSQLEDRTEKMMNEAENFSSTAHALMIKNKDKKWYQL